MRWTSTTRRCWTICAGCLTGCLNDWGFDLVKLDFLYGAAPFGNIHESRAARMRRAMELLRSWCGQKPSLAAACR